MFTNTNIALELANVQSRIVRSESIFEWVNRTGAEAQVSIQTIGGVAIAIVAVVIFFKSKMRIGALLGGAVVLSLGAWLVLSDGWAFGQGMLDDTVTTSPAIVSVEPHGLAA